MMKSQKASLKVHEWLAIVLLCACILVISLMTRNSSTPLLIQSHPEYHEILVRGAVAYPGVYQIHPGTSLEEVLTLCEVCPHADLRRFKLSSPVKKGRVLNIPTKKATLSKAR